MITPLLALTTIVVTRSASIIDIPLTCTDVQLIIESKQQLTSDIDSIQTF